MLLSVGVGRADQLPAVPTPVAPTPTARARHLTVATASVAKPSAPQMQIAQLCIQAPPIALKASALLTQPAE